MPRLMSDAMIAAFRQPIVRPYRAVSIAFRSGELNLWTGQNTRTIGGKLFIGNGTLLQFEDVVETSGIEATGTSVTLSGVDSSLVAVAIDEPYQGVLAKLYLGELSVPNELLEIGTGYVDQMLIDDNPQYTTIQLTIENALIDLETPRVSRYTDEEQQLLFPGDRAFEYVAGLQEKTIKW